MAIFNSYVELPEGKYSLLLWIKLVEVHFQGVELSVGPETSNLADQVDSFRPKRSWTCSCTRALIKIVRIILLRNGTPVTLTDTHTSNILPDSPNFYIQHNKSPPMTLRLRSCRSSRDGRGPSSTTQSRGCWAPTQRRGRICPVTPGTLW